jgi:hypothetical protein
MAPDIFTTRAKVVEFGERAVVIAYGLPARPVLLPLAVVDAEPLGFDDSPLGCEGFYRFTMSREVAKEYGLTV